MEVSVEEVEVVSEANVCCFEAESETNEEIVEENIDNVYVESCGQPGEVVEIVVEETINNEEIYVENEAQIFEILNNGVQSAQLVKNEYNVANLADVKFLTNQHLKNESNENSEQINIEDVGEKVVQTINEQIDSKNVLKIKFAVEERNLNAHLLKDEKRVKLEPNAADVQEIKIVKDEKGMFQCIFCWKQFFKKQQLQNHLKIHMGVRNYECSLCLKRFVHKQQLENHFKIHTGEKNFACNVCSKRFTHKQQMQNHLKIHTGLKEHECNLCPKRFTLKQQLQNHLKVHAGIKQHACEFCPKTFTLKQQLHNHLKIHLGVKDFLCSSCEKQFRTKQQLERHMVVHGSEKEGNNSTVRGGEKEGDGAVHASEREGNGDEIKLGIECDLGENA